MKTYSKSKEPGNIVVEGVRVGLKAFIITYLTAFILSLIINLSVIEKIQDYLQGTLSENVGFDFGLVIKGTSLIMNASVFNSSGPIQLGLLIFGVLPLFAFYLADRSDNKDKGMDMVGFIIYLAASLIFTLLLMSVSYLTQGNLLGMDINFVSVRNGLMTFVITLLIQIAIGMNYNMNRLPGVLATRWMVRLVFSFTSLASIAGILLVALPYTRSISLILLAMIVLVPNMAVYLFFMMFGVSIDFNESLEKVLAFVDMDLSYTALPIWLRLTLIVLFILFALFSVTRIDKGRYYRGLAGFALIFSSISLLVAYCTVVNLGVVRGLVDIQLGIRPLQAFLYPLCAVILVGFMYLLFMDLLRGFREQ